MRYVPSLPPAVSPVDTEARKQVGQARAVRPVSEPAIPPIVISHYRRTGEAGGPQPVQPPVERRTLADRRQICRRLVNGRDKFPQLDSRGEKERRRRNRRRADVRTNVDEQV